MGNEEQTRILHLFGQGQQLLSQLACSPVLRPQLVEFPEAPQDGSELSRLPRPLTQLPRPRVRRSDLGSGEAQRGPKRHAQRDLERELPAGELGGVRQPPEQLQSPDEVTDRLRVCRAFDGSLPRALPVRQGLRDETGFGVVMGQQLGLSIVSGSRSSIARAICW